jgi:CelD/BcsL family acetyltransferase involved in cellulose biosynthesis
MNFRLGDLHLFEAKLPVRTPSNFFPELETAVNLDTLVPGPGETLLISSLPIKTPPPRLVSRHGVLRYTPRIYHRYMADLTRSTDGIFEHMSSKSRYNIRRTVKKFGEAHGSPIDMREYRSPEQVSEYLENAWRVSTTTYQERLLDSGLPRDDGFVQRTRNFAERGHWRGYLLFAQEQAIAFVYCYMHEGIMRYAYIGFDPAHSKLSPGIVLQVLMLERMCAERCSPWLDYTQGNGLHKELFSTHDWLCADVWLMHPTLYNRGLLGVHTVIDQVGTSIGSLLNRWGIKSWVRRRMRRQ